MTSQALNGHVREIPSAISNTMASEDRAGEFGLWGKDAPSSDMAAFRELFSKARNIVVLSGAGISAESGVPTFRLVYKNLQEKNYKWSCCEVAIKTCNVLALCDISILNLQLFQ